MADATKAAAAGCSLTLSTTSVAALRRWRSLCDAHRAGAQAAGANFADRLEAVRLDDLAEAHATEVMRREARSGDRDAASVNEFSVTSAGARPVAMSPEVRELVQAARAALPQLCDNSSRGLAERDRLERALATFCAYPLSPCTCGGPHA